MCQLQRGHNECQLKVSNALPKIQRLNIIIVLVELILFL